MKLLWLKKSLRTKTGIIVSVICIFIFGLSHFYTSNFLEDHLLRLEGMNSFKRTNQDQIFSRSEIITNKSNTLNLENQKLLKIFLFINMTSSIFIVFFIVFYIDRTIINKIISLKNTINSTPKNKGLNGPVPSLGSDEIEELENSYHSMIQEISRLKEMTLHNEKLASLGEMAGGIAHEINNPMSIIKAAAELLKSNITRGNFTLEKNLKYFDLIDNTISRMVKIIQGLKNISRNTHSEQIVPCSLKDILDDSLSLCVEKFKLGGVELKVFLEDPVFNTPFQFLRVQLSQVFLNLLTNSFDAVEKQKNPWVEITAHIDVHGTLTIYFKDSGNGIPMDIQSQIFQPFYTTKEVGKGTGLGLSLSNSIIKAHNGNLYVDNDCPNTCFVMKFQKGAI